MVYEKQPWANGDAGGTPLNAARLNHMDTQYDEAMAAVAAAGYAKADLYPILAQSYVWSYANNLSGAGPGGVTIDATAGANIPRNTTSKASEGYVAIGRDALGAATWGRGCIAIGSLALGLGNPGFANLAIGMWALSHVTGVDYAAGSMPGSRNIGIGALAGHFVSSGYRNAFLGRDAGQTVTTGSSNTGLGYRAATSGFAPVGLDGTIVNQLPSTASNNTAVGDTAGSLWTNNENVAIGYFAGAYGRNTSSNVFIGSSAGKNIGYAVSENNKVITSPNVTGTYTQTGTTITVTTSSASGVVVGNMVSVAFTSGGINAVTGEAQWVQVASVVSATVFTVVSTVSTTTNGNCTVQRVETADAAVTGGANTIIGFQAMADALNNDGNSTVVGEQAARGATGARNSIFGSRAGYNLTTAADSTFVGYNAGRALSTGGGQTVESNTTAIGSGSAVSGANQVQLGNSATTTYVYGTVQNRSDERDKADIRDTVLGLDWVVKHPRPKDYRWDMREDYIEYDEDGAVVNVHDRDGSKKRERFHHGVIAQEVEAYIEETGVDFGGFQDHARTGGADVKSIGYDEYVAALLASVQDLHAIVVKQGEEIERLKSAR